MMSDVIGYIREYREGRNLREVDMMKSMFNMWSLRDPQEGSVQPGRVQEI